MKNRKYMPKLIVTQSFPSIQLPWHWDPGIFLSAQNLEGNNEGTIKPGGVRQTHGSFYFTIKSQNIEFKSSETESLKRS